MMRPLARRDERGATAFITALLSVVIFGCAAIAIDISTLAMERQQLHDHIDSAAHAGAFELPADGVSAKDAALDMATSHDSGISPDVGLLCVVASTGSSRLVREDQLPSTCNPGPAPYTVASYPGLRCNDKICAIPCEASASTACNTVRVSEAKDVPYGFANIFGKDHGTTGAVVSAACKGSCGEESPNPLDVVIMADRTASMRYDDRTKMKSAILESLKTMNTEMHYVAFGALHKSRLTAHTLRTSTYGPQTDDYVVDYNTSCVENCSQDSNSKRNYNGHWDGTGDTNNDFKCLTEAYTKAPASTNAPISKWTSSKKRPTPGMADVTKGVWVPVDFTNDYLVGGEVPLLNNSSALVDGVSCLSQSIASEYGTHLAGALKGAVRHALDNNPAPNRAPGVDVKKVIVFETDGMPDETSSAFGDTSLTSGDVGGPGQSGGGVQTCQNFLDVAQKAKDDEDLLLITIGFGDAATKRCRKDGGSSEFVRDVLAEAASEAPSGLASDANSCAGADVEVENTDGDYFFCATDGDDLAEIFKTAIAQVSTSIRLLQIPE